MPEGKLEKADLVTRARCLGPLSGLRPAQLKRLIEATAHEHSGCVEKAELIACLLAAIEAGGKATRERAVTSQSLAVTDDQGLEPGKSNFSLAAQEWSERERELSDEMAARARTAAERFRAEETAKARAMLAAAELEEQKDAEEREAAAAERRWLQERKVLLQVEAANQQVKLLEKRLALEHEQQKRQAAEREHLEAKLREATQASVRAHASEAAHAAESQITRLQLEDNQRQMERVQAELHTLQKQHELEKEILISAAKAAEQQQQQQQEQEQQEELLRRNAPSEPPPTPPASKQQHLLELLAAGPTRPRAASRDSVASPSTTPVATNAGPSKYYSDEEEAMMALYAEADQADPERVDEAEAEAFAAHRRAIDALAAASTPALDALAASVPRGLTGGGCASVPRGLTGGGVSGGGVSPSSRVQALLSETAPTEGTWSAVPHAQQPPSTAQPGLAQLGARPSTTLGVSRGEPLPNTKQRVEAALEALYRKNGGEAPGLLLQQVRIPNSRIQRFPRPGEAHSPPDAALPVTSTLLRGLAAWPSPSPASRMPLPAEL